MSAPVQEPLVAEAVGWRDADGVERLRDVELRVGAGECVCLVGEAGLKSQLLRVLYGLDPPGAGRVRLLGEELAGLGAAGRLEVWARTGFVFAEGALISNLTVRENVELPLRHRGELTARQIRERAASLLHDLDLGPAAEERPWQLRLSIRKRAALARALATRPRILFADELLVLGDPESPPLVRAAIEHARKRWGLTLVLAEAAAEPAVPLAPRLLFLQGTTLSARPARGRGSSCYSCR